MCTHKIAQTSKTQDNSNQHQSATRGCTGIPKDYIIYIVLGVVGLLAIGALIVTVRYFTVRRRRQMEAKKLEIAISKYDPSVFIKANLNCQLTQQPYMAPQLEVAPPLLMQQENARVAAGKSMNMDMTRILNITAPRSRSFTLAEHLSLQVGSGMSRSASMYRRGSGGGDNEEAYDASYDDEGQGPCLGAHIYTGMEPSLPLMVRDRSSMMSFRDIDVSDMMTAEGVQNARDRSTALMKCTDVDVLLANAGWDVGVDNTTVRSDTEASVAYMFASERLSSAYHRAANITPLVTLADRGSPSRSHSLRNSSAEYTNSHGLDKSPSLRLPGIHHSRLSSSASFSRPPASMQGSRAASRRSSFNQEVALDMEALEASIVHPLPSAIHPDPWLDLEDDPATEDGSPPTSPRSPQSPRADARMSSAEYTASYQLDVNRPSPLGTASRLGYSASLSRSTSPVQITRTASSRRSCSGAVYSNVLPVSNLAPSSLSHTAPLSNTALQAWSHASPTSDSGESGAEYDRGSSCSSREHLRSTRSARVSSAEYATINKIDGNRPSPMRTTGTQSPKIALQVYLAQQAAQGFHHERSSTGSPAVSDYPNRMSAPGLGRRPSLLTTPKIVPIYSTPVCHTDRIAFGERGSDVSPPTVRSNLQSARAQPHGAQPPSTISRGPRPIGNAALDWAHATEMTDSERGRRRRSGDDHSPGMAASTTAMGSVKPLGNRYRRVSSVMSQSGTPLSAPREAQRGYLHSEAPNTFINRDVPRRPRKLEQGAWLEDLP